MKEIRKKIKEEILKSGMTRTEIAKKIGVTQGTISQYVMEVSLPALDTLAKICVVLDVSADYILGIENYDGKKNV